MAGDLLIRRDDAAGLVLAASPLPKIVAALFFGALSIGLAFTFPQLQAAPILFGVLALWQAAGLLFAHDLAVDPTTRRLVYRHGRRFAPPAYDGPYLWQDDADLDAEAPEAPPELDPSFAHLAVHDEAHAGDPGIASTRLRSRRLVLEVRLPGTDEPLRFPLGFPMGPKAAEAKVEELRARLG